MTVEVADTRAVEALLQARADQLDSLSKLSDAVTRTASLDDTYEAALDCLADTLSPDRASVLLFDDDGVLRFKAWRRLSDDYRRSTEGHTPWSADTRDPQPVLVEDVGAEPSLAGLRPVIEGEGIRSLGFFPLIGRERLLGKFMIYYDRPHHFTPSEVRLAQAIGSHIALEIARRRAEEEVVRARDIAERLQAVTAALAAALTTTEIASTVVREGAAALGAAAGWIATVDRERRALQRVASIGYDPTLGDTYASLPLDDRNVTVEAVLHERPFWFASADQVIEANPELDPDYRRAGFQAMAVVPFAVGGAVVGVIALNFTEPKTFRDDEQGLLLALAAQCGQALDRAKLYSELQERADAASVLAHVGDGVFQVDLDDRVVLWNRGAEVLTGLTESHALGRRIGELFVGWDEVRSRVSITDSPVAFGRREAVPVQVGSRELWLAISGVAKAEGVVYAFRDVTESEALEKARKDFLATASHELRTPLAGVFGATKTLLHVALEKRLERELLEMIDAESQRLARILDEILVAARADAGQIDLEIRGTDVVELASEVIASQRSRAPAEVTFRLDAGVDVPRAACDPVKLRQVLVNLLDNAMKYSPEGGTIALGVESAGHRVRLSVSDQGIGIAPAEHERIFEKFYRLDPQLSRGVGGTGLGLYISREFITRMNGSIWVESDPARGSTFHVELPLAR
jgi:two-component system, OmpR family, phosphate regulon sensor histidine kinase PhoR